MTPSARHMARAALTLGLDAALLRVLAARREHHEQNGHMHEWSHSITP